MTKDLKVSRQYGYVRFHPVLTFDELVKVNDLIPDGTTIHKDTIDLYHVGSDQKPLHLPIPQAVQFFLRLSVDETEERR